MIDAGNHKLILDVPQEPLWVNADLTRLSQVVSNLLNNAAKYTPAGGIITLTARAQNEEAMLCVADNGLGIPADMLPKVFDLFTQVDRNLDRSQGGLGIGLSLVRRLLEMHNGTIHVNSDGLNKGSKFTAYIPLLSHNVGAKEDDQNTSGDTVTTKPPLNILVVDDNVPSAKTIGWMLELAGYEYSIVHTGTEAIEAAKKLKPDVILLDIGLPGISGYDVCRELRKDNDFKNTIMIAQTGWGQERDRQMAKEAGFDHHLIKPVNFDDFSKLIGEINK